MCHISRAGLEEEANQLFYLVRPGLNERRVRCFSRDFGPCGHAEWPNDLPSAYSHGSRSVESG